MESVPAFELDLTETVNVPQSVLDAYAKFHTDKGRRFQPAPSHRQEHTHLIVQGKRMLMERKLPNASEGRESRTSTFFDGKKSYSLLSDTAIATNPNFTGIGQVEEAVPREIINLISLKPVFIAFRGLDKQVSRVNLDDYKITAQDASSVTLRQQKLKGLIQEIVLQRNKNFMPIAFRIFADDKVAAEGTISYQPGDHLPYVPESWSVVAYTSSGTTIGIRNVDSFSLKPATDLATYTLAFPEGTHIISQR
jgi:hypothetical protein